MRMSTAMMHNRALAVENSTFYKNYKAQKGDKSNSNKTDSDKTNEKEQSVKIGKNTVVEKSGDKLIISRVDKDNKKSKLEEVDIKSDNGKMLLNFMNASKPTQLDNCLSDMKAAKKTMNLTNYL